VIAPVPDAPVGREERHALLLAATGFFCLMCGYYTLRPLREALALEVGVQYNDILFATVFACSAALLPIYWWLVGRTPRGRLPWLVSTPFVLVFLGLALALSWYPRDRNVAFVYFVALSTANLFLISIFWSAMADVWRPALAKRFYGYVAAGGSAGALLGPKIVSSLVHETGPAPLIVMACGFIMGSALFASLARRALRRAPDGLKVPDAAIPVGGRAVDDLRRMAGSPYLLGIAGIIVAGQIIGGFMYSEQGKLVAATHSSLADRAALFSTLEFYVNALSLVFQAVVVTWLTRRGSVPLSLAAMPVLIGGSFVVMALVPTAAVFLTTQVVRRAADYGLGKPPREMLFTVLNPESKFKSKSLIDTVLQRGSDAIAQLIYPLIAVLGLAGIAWVCAALCVGLMGIVHALGKGFENRQRAAPFGVRAP
jgi:ATP:ADP antiporter, AAA family